MASISVRGNLTSEVCVMQAFVVPSYVLRQPLPTTSLLLSQTTSQTEITISRAHFHLCSRLAWPNIGSSWYRPPLSLTLSSCIYSTRVLHACFSMMAPNNFVGFFWWKMWAGNAVAPSSVMCVTAMCVTAMCVTAMKNAVSEKLDGRR